MGTGPKEAAGPDLFTPIVPGRISGLIVDRIRTLISEGRLAPGDRLPSERELAEQFGVSRVTVRDALRALEAGGLVEIKVGANGGAVMRAPTSEVVGQGISDMLLMAALTPEEVAEARLLFEAHTVHLVVERATDEDIADLHRICRRSAEALEAGDYDVHLSWEFHERLARATHNHAIELLTRSFRGPLSMARARAREGANIAHERSVHEHTELAAAIEARDAERARRVLAAHLARATNVRARLSTLGFSVVAETDTGSAGKEPRERRDGAAKPDREQALPSGVDPVDPLKRSGDGEEEEHPGADPVTPPVPPG
jgi:GntR family transcriptional regulator, transcriptional repressor for pyruvate dehydrogenase complex